MKIKKIGKKYEMLFIKGDYESAVDLIDEDTLNEDGANMDEYYCTFYFITLRVGNQGGDYVGKVNIRIVDKNTLDYDLTHLEDGLPVRDYVKIVDKITGMVATRRGGRIRLFYNGDISLKEVAKRCGYDTISFKDFAQYEDTLPDILATICITI